MEEELARGGFAAPVRAEKKRLHIGYEPLFEDSACLTSLPVRY